MSQSARSAFALLSSQLPLPLMRSAMPEVYWSMSLPEPLRCIMMDIASRAPLYSSPSNRPISSAKRPSVVVVVCCWPYPPQPPKLPPPLEAPEPPRLIPNEERISLRACAFTDRMGLLLPLSSTSFCTRGASMCVSMFTFTESRSVTSTIALRVTALAEMPPVSSLRNTPFASKRR